MSQHRRAALLRARALLRAECGAGDLARELGAGDGKAIERLLLALKVPSMIGHDITLLHLKRVAGSSKRHVADEK
jgi:hypothetical protein